MFEGITWDHMMSPDICTGCLHRKRDSENDELGNSQLGLACVHEHW